MAGAAVTPSETNHERITSGDCHALVTNNWNYIMARTFRRKNAKHEHAWVLRDWQWNGTVLQEYLIDPHSKAGRKALLRFHSDMRVKMGPAPRWYRKVSDHRIRTKNSRLMRRWLDDPEFDPVFQAWHKHDANWSWW